MIPMKHLLAPIFLAIPCAHAATTLMNWNPEVNNGAFTGLTTTDFSPWVSLSTGGPEFPTTLPSPGSGGPNFTITRDRQIGYDLGYTVGAGDTYSISFAWRDAANWDAADTMDMTLFYTDDNTLTGARTTLVTLNSGGRDALTTWESESLAGAGFSDASAVGKKLFVVLSATDVTQGEFARVDDVFVEVQPVPEPTSTLLFGIAGAAIAVRRRR